MYWQLIFLIPLFLRAKEKKGPNKAPLMHHSANGFLLSQIALSKVYELLKQCARLTFYTMPDLAEIAKPIPPFYLSFATFLVSNHSSTNQVNSIAKFCNRDNSSVKLV